MLTRKLGGMIKTDRIPVSANNATSVTLTLTAVPATIISVYADGGSPVVIDRIGAPSGNSVTLHLTANLTTDTRFKIVYV